jgi:hypothetical protein
MIHHLVESGDRPADEIEVTPEMIEAGIAEFCSYDSRYERPRDAVASIFRAMANLTPKACSSAERRSQA